MAANQEDERNLDRVKKEMLKLEQMKEDIKCETRELALKRNALLEISQSTCATRNSRPSEAIRKTSFAIKKIIETGQHPFAAIEKLQLAIVEKEITHLVTGAQRECDVTLSADGLFILINGYKFKLPYETLIRSRFSSTSPCKGCGQLFPCREKLKIHGPSSIVFHVSYFRHIFACSNFMSMDSIKYCHDCKLVFLNAIRLGIHRNKHHPRASKPIQMKYGTYRRSGRKFPLKKVCLGCKMEFKATPNYGTGHVYTERKYYVHCIEQCSEYKKLNLIRKCSECDRLFLNKHALGVHMSAKHSGEVAEEPVRSWMTQNLRRKKRYNYSYNSNKECEGCGKKFPCWKNLSGKTHLICRSYYIHCVEECELYRALGKIFTCANCNCKFLHNRHSCS